MKTYNRHGERVYIMAVTADERNALISMRKDIAIEWAKILKTTRAATQKSMDEVDALLKPTPLDPIEQPQCTYPACSCEDRANESANKNCPFRFDPLNIKMPAFDVLTDEAAREDIARTRSREHITPKDAHGVAFTLPVPAQFSKWPICSRCEGMHEPSDIQTCILLKPDNPGHTPVRSEACYEFDELGMRSRPQ